MQIERGDVAGIAVLVICKGINGIRVTVRYCLGRLKCSTREESHIVCKWTREVSWT